MREFGGFRLEGIVYFCVVIASIGKPTLQLLDVVNFPRLGNYIRSVIIKNNVCLNKYIFRVDKLGYRCAVCHETWYVNVKIHRISL